MRVMVKFRFPNDSGNEVIRTGRIAQIVQGILDDLKPEAAYFFPDGGERAGLLVVDMENSSQVALACERFFFGLNAKVELTPVMAIEDLQAGLASIEQVVQRYG
jgi:hypothetical protein